MLNWAVGREYVDRTPFRRGTEVLIRMELEDNKRRRRISEAEEAALLSVASPHLRGKTFDPKTEATDRLSRIFQDPTGQSFARSEGPAKESATSH
jgi:hypothetical protein